MPKTKWHLLCGHDPGNTEDDEENEGLNSKVSGEYGLDHRYIVFDIGRNQGRSRRESQRPVLDMRKYKNTVAERLNMEKERLEATTSEGCAKIIAEAKSVAISPTGGALKLKTYRRCTENRTQYMCKIGRNTPAEPTLQELREKIFKKCDQKIKKNSLTGIMRKARQRRGKMVIRL